MANKLVRTNIFAASLVSPSSRYIDSKVVYYTDQHKLTFTTYRRHEYRPSEKDRWMVVKKTEEYRPDKVAHAAYGVPGFWWKLLEANGMKDIWDFKSGLTVWLPANIY